jgi:hypothetical protein
VFRAREPKLFRSFGFLKKCHHQQGLDARKDSAVAVVTPRQPQIGQLKHDSLHHLGLIKLVIYEHSSNQILFYSAYEGDRI